MADELEISTSAYSKIERGVTDPSIGRLEQIATILQVEIIDFLQEPAPVKKLEDKDKAYGFVDREEIETISNMVKQLKAELTILKKETAAIKVKKKK